MNSTFSAKGLAMLWESPFRMASFIFKQKETKSEVKSYIV